MVIDHGNIVATRSLPLNIDLSGAPGCTSIMFTANLTSLESDGVVGKTTSYFNSQMKKQIMIIPQISLDDFELIGAYQSYMGVTT